MPASPANADAPNGPRDERAGRRALDEVLPTFPAPSEAWQSLGVDADRAIRAAMELAGSRLLEGPHSGEAVLLRLSLIDTVSALDVSRLTAVVGTEPPRLLSTSHGPTPEELERAVRTLVEHAASAHRDRWEAVVDLLADTPALDADRLYQAQRHAEHKRWLLSHVRLLGTGDVVDLMPDRFGAGRNASRVLERLRADGTLLGVVVGRDWRYAADQFDARGEPHAALAPLVREARAQGYDAWEILHWLARPCTTLPVEVEPGRPIDGLDPDASLDEIVSAAAESDGAAPRPDPLPSPFAWLARGDTEHFERAAAGWLGR